MTYRLRSLREVKLSTAFLSLLLKLELQWQVSKGNPGGTEGAGGGAFPLLVFLLVFMSDTGVVIPIISLVESRCEHSCRFYSNRKEGTDLGCGIFSVL